MKFVPQSSLLLLAIFMVEGSLAWIAPTSRDTIRASGPLRMALKVGKNYTPKWKKKATLAEQENDSVPQDKGIVGTVPVVFQSGESSISTTASPGDPIRAVASQAGQFIKYGCGKGDCGTCQAMCNGKFIRPCIAVVPELAEGEKYVIEVKEVKNKGRSSGKFYSVRSFFMGFYNNVLGMIGMVTTRRAAKKNFSDRIEYEDMVAKKTAERKAEKLKQDVENMRP